MIRKEYYKERGITLIALIITIIILLILAGVVLNLVIGERGILKVAQDAKTKTEQAANDEAESLNKLDEYIKDNIGGNNDNKISFENNGIDKSHDGAQYDAVTTKDGMWTIYKDIDTKTKKVNVYVTSKYYKPSFEQFVLEKYYLNEFLYNYALPIYSFSDLSDFYADNVIEVLMDIGIINDESLLEQYYENEYIKRRREEMGVGPFFSELLELLGVDEYDVYKEVGKVLVKQLKEKEYLGIEIGESIEINGENWINILMSLNDAHSPELTYENLLSTYNNLYGDKENLVISEEEKNKMYKIELPNGKIEEIKGTDLYKAKFRYVTTKNGDLQIKISSNSNEAETINYKGVTNIDNCIYEDEEYTYTYNCLPFLDEARSLTMHLNEYGYSYPIEDYTIYRFNLGGWNVARKKIYNNINELYFGAEEKIFKTQFKNTINGEPITAMCGTYYRGIVTKETINIPDTVKYMFDTFRYGDITDITELELPRSLEYGMYVEAEKYNKTFVYKVHESIKKNLKSLEGYTIDELIAMGLNINIYK